MRVINLSIKSIKFLSLVIVLTLLMPSALMASMDGINKKKKKVVRKTSSVSQKPVVATLNMACDASQNKVEIYVQLPHGSTFEDAQNLVKSVQGRTPNSYAISLQPPAQTPAHPQSVAPAPTPAQTSAFAAETFNGTVYFGVVLPRALEYRDAWEVYNSVADSIRTRSIITGSRGCTDLLGSGAERQEVTKSS